MIISKSPLRISIAGGGTDLPSYYNLRGRGKTISLAINKYIYIIIKENHLDRHSIKYSAMESVDYFQNIRHPIFREALQPFEDENKKIEVISVGDFSSGTGLGSSGAFTVSLLNACSIFYSQPLDTYSIADNACKIEIDKLKQIEFLRQPSLSCFIDYIITQQTIKI